MKNLSKIVIVTVVALMALTAVVPTAYAAQPDLSGNNIVDIASHNPNFTTLTAAVVCTGLAPALSSKGQITVFAPTDAAFAKLSLNAGNVCSALPKAALKNILLYHVARGARFSGDVLSSDQIRMLNGKFTYPSLRNGVPYINDSQIIVPDLRASNGVIHVIDAVLMPKP